MKIKKCPCCESNSSFIEKEGQVWIECGNCELKTKKYQLNEENKKILAREWNERKYEAKLYEMYDALGSILFIVDTLVGGVSDSIKDAKKIYNKYKSQERPRNAND